MNLNLFLLSLSMIFSFNQMKAQNLIAAPITANVSWDFSTWAATSNTTTSNTVVNQLGFFAQPDTSTSITDFGAIVNKSITFTGDGVSGTKNCQTNGAGYTGDFVAMPTQGFFILIYLLVIQF